MSGVNPRGVRRDIEGLRAVAVGLVVAYHLGFRPFSGGFVGVDVFFVISGFLITHHLVSEAERTGRVRIGRFYARRARRLLPAAGLVLACTAAAGIFLLSADQYRDLATDVALAAVYVVNWGFADRAVDYLAEDAGLSPVQHYWSLAVEEQFYLVVPVVVLVLALIATRRGWSVRAVVGLCLSGVVALSLWYSIALTSTDPAAAFFLTPTRVWELAVGAVLACLIPALRRLRRPAAQGLAAAGAVALIVGVVITDSATPWPGAAALWPVLGTAALIAAGTAGRPTAVGAMLGVRPMVWIGGLSYAIYLWHWPLVAFAEARGLSGWWVTAAIVTATLGLAVLTRRLVEDPIRFGAAFAGLGRGALVAALATVVSLSAAFAVWTAVPSQSERPEALIGAEVLPGFEQIPDATDDPPAPLPTTGPVTPEPALAEDDYPVLYDDGCQIENTSADFRTDCIYGDPEGDITVALIGDSKAAQWLTPIAAIGADQGWRVQVLTRSACGVNPALAENAEPLCADWIGQVIDYLTSDQGRADIVITSMGASEPDLGTEVDPTYVAGHQQFWTQLEDAGTQVVALMDNPYPDRSQLPAAAETIYGCVTQNRQDWSVCQVPVTEGAGGTGALRQAAREMPQVAVLDLNELICPDRVCPPVIGEVLVFRQGSHLTDSYASSLEPAIREQLIAAGVLRSD